MCYFINSTLRSSQASPTYKNVLALIAMPRQSIVPLDIPAQYSLNFPNKAPAVSSPPAKPAEKQTNTNWSWIPYSYFGDEKAVAFQLGLLFVPFSLSSPLVSFNSTRILRSRVSWLTDSPLTKLLRFRSEGRKKKKKKLGHRSIDQSIGNGEFHRGVDADHEGIFGAVLRQVPGGSSLRRRRSAHRRTAGDLGWSV